VAFISLTRLTDRLLPHTRNEPPAAESRKLGEDPALHRSWRCPVLAQPHKKFEPAQNAFAGSYQMSASNRGDLSRAGCSIEIRRA